MQLFAVFGGGHSHLFGEYPGKVKLIAKTNRTGNVCNAHVCRFQQVQALFNAELGKILNGRIIRFFHKNTVQVAPAQANVIRQIMNGYIVGIILCDKLVYFKNILFAVILGFALGLIFPHHLGKQDIQMTGHFRLVIRFLPLALQNLLDIRGKIL